MQQTTEFPHILRRAYEASSVSVVIRIDPDPDEATLHLATTLPYTRKTATAVRMPTQLYA